MSAPVPRVMVPARAKKGEIFEVRAIISHQMETGLRYDQFGQVIPRKIINQFKCLYNGEAVFSVALHEAMSANPFFGFWLRATESGRIEFVWDEDGGAVFRVAHVIEVA